MELVIYLHCLARDVGKEMKLLVMFVDKIHTLSFDALRAEI